jgi:DNA-directed RNA polymerase I subunit RPA49
MIRYLPGLYDPETNTLTLTPAPLYLMSHREAFGTRKAKSQIKAQERGKVNAAAMESVKDHLMDSIVVNEETEGESLD